MFALRVEPSAQRVSVDGDKRKATINKFEIWFRSADGPVISISRATGTFRLIAPIDGAEDSRAYLLYEGSCTLS